MFDIKISFTATLFCNKYKQQISIFPVNYFGFLPDVFYRFGCI